MVTETTHRPPSSRSAEILDFVARAGPLTIADIVRTLGVTTTAVRQQVNRLLWSGWLVREQRRHGPGRPADVFSLSEQAERAFADHVDDFARLLVEEIADADGPDRLAWLLERVSRRLAHDLEAQAGPGRPAERVERFVQLLQQGGTVADVRPTGAGLRLSVHTCPFHGLGQARRPICEIERESLARLAGGSAQLKQSLASGQASCEFEVGLDPGAVRNDVAARARSIGNGVRI